MKVQAPHLSALAGLSAVADPQTDRDWALIDPGGTETPKEAEGFPEPSVRFYSPEPPGPCAVLSTGAVLLSVPLSAPEGIPYRSTCFRPYRPHSSKGSVEIAPGELANRGTGLTQYRILRGPPLPALPFSRVIYDPDLLDPVTRHLKGGVEIFPHRKTALRVHFLDHPGVLCLIAMIKDTS